MNFSGNYGGMLQAYCLMSFLKRKGHDVFLIRLKQKYKTSKIIKVFIKRVYLRFIANAKHINLNFVKEIQIIERESSNFVEKFINPQTESYYKNSNFKKLQKHNFDVVIVGSDQVWRRRMYIFFEYAFLNFLGSNTKKISYAASFGNDVWEYSKSQTIKAQKEIKEFKRVSVREKSGVELCEKYLGVSAVHVLDPTMLFSTNFYDEIIESEKCHYSGTEFITYILDKTSEKGDLINFISKILNIESTEIGQKDNSIFSPIEKRVYPKVGEWLAGFKNAKYLVTDSFHGCVFAIIYNVPFVVIANEDRGVGRLKSLLELFGLNDRLLLGLDNKKANMIKEFIDWKKVNEILKDERLKSETFLTESINF